MCTRAVIAHTRQRSPRRSREEGGETDAPPSGRLPRSLRRGTEAARIRVSSVFHLKGDQAHREEVPVQTRSLARLPPKRSRGYDLLEEWVDPPLTEVGDTREWTSALERRVAKRAALALAGRAVDAPSPRTRSRASSPIRGTWLHPRPPLRCRIVLHHDLVHLVFILLSLLALLPTRVSCPPPPESASSCIRIRPVRRLAQGLVRRRAAPDTLLELAPTNAESAGGPGGNESRDRKSVV